jgi:hypothetical protein
VKLLDWANEIRSAVGLGPDDDFRAVERRREPRKEISGRKIVVRQRKALGILHLKNLSSNGGCGITAMPLAVGSLVFVQLRKPLFQAAEVRWVRSLSIGLEFLRPLRPDMFDTNRASPDEPKKRRSRRRSGVAP